MKNFTALIEDYLSGEGIPFVTKELNRGTDTLIGVRTRDGESLLVHIINPESDPPYLSVWELIHVPDDKMAAALIASNEDNDRKFFRLCVDDDQDLNLNYSFPAGLSNESFPPVLKAMFRRFLAAVEVYRARYVRIIRGDQSSDNEIRLA